MADLHCHIEKKMRHIETKKKVCNEGKKRAMSESEVLNLVNDTTTNEFSPWKVH